MAERRTVGFAGRGPTGEPLKHDASLARVGAPLSVEFDVTPALAFAEGGTVWMVDADQLAYEEIPPRSRALLRGLLMHALARLDQTEGMR